MTTTILNVENLSFSSGKKEIIKDISFRLNHGEFTCVIGPNGAGKSTLLKSIVRILKSTGGEISALNKTLSSYTQKELGKIISYVPQQPGRLPAFKVKEFIAMSRFPYSSFSQPLLQVDKDIINKTLKDVDLLDFTESILTTLSGGELQRVMIAAALVQEAKIILLDEPFASQDPHHQEEVYALLQKLKRKQSLTVLCVCHDLNIAMRLSDRIIALKAGQIIFNDTPSAFLSENKMQELYDTSFIKIDSAESRFPLIFTKGLINE